MAASCLAACAATKEQVVSTLDERFVGKNVDSITAEFGPPSNMSKMTSGDTAYVWQLTSNTRVDGEKVGTSMSVRSTTRYCRIKAVASPAGIVTSLTTEDSAGTGGIWRSLNVDVWGSLCGQYLEMKRTS